MEHTRKNINGKISRAGSALIHSQYIPRGLINVCLAVKLIIPRIRLPRRETKKEQHRAKHSGATGIFAVSFLQFALGVHPAFTHTRRSARKQRCATTSRRALAPSLSLSLSFLATGIASRKISFARSPAPSQRGDIRDFCPEIQRF
jgi:hypothetical protein